jgi:hypothetical protein
MQKSQKHEYLRDTRYVYCNSCKKRIQFACIKCGFCWSCHWLKEEMERILPEMTPMKVYSQLTMTIIAAISISSTPKDND